MIPRTRFPSDKLIFSELVKIFLNSIRGHDLKSNSPLEVPIMEKTDFVKSGEF
jgi:hypothetical protein